MIREEARRWWQWLLRAREPREEWGEGPPAPEPDSVVLMRLDAAEEEKRAEGPGASD